MSALLRETLVRRAEGAPVPSYDAEALAALGEARLRRRTGIVVASAAAVVLVIVVAVIASEMTRGSKDSTPPVIHPSPTPTELPFRQSTRKILWAEVPFKTGVGLVHDRGRIHYGSAVLELEHAFVSTDVTDDGFVWVSPRHEVWFSDGDTRERIGTHQCFGGAHGSPTAVVTDDGSRAVWFDCSAPGRPVLVVHSTDGADERRLTVNGCISSAYCDLRTMVGHHVYWQRTTTRGRGDSRLWRLDLSTGTRGVVTEADLAADLRDQNRTLVLGRSPATGLVSDGIGLELVPRGRILETATDPDYQAHAQRIWVATSGTPVRLRLPAGYHGANPFTLTQWLDDDTVALVADTGDWGPQQGWTGDIVRCRLSTGRCVQVARSPGGSRLVLAAGQGLPG